MKRVVIIGAGPAGITAGYELMKKKGYKVTILEAENSIGGLAKAVLHANNRLDIGGHRFFTKNWKVNLWWLKLFPIQARPAYDYYKTQRKLNLPETGPSPHLDDIVMLKRQRFSHIIDGNKNYPYPMRFNSRTILNIGIKNTFKALSDYLKIRLKPLEQNSLEDFYINRFGNFLYRKFLESYLEKILGKHPKDLSADMGAQKIKGLTLGRIIKNSFYRTFHLKCYTEPSLAREFYYPKFGPGHFWETVASKITSSGGKLVRNAKVVEIKLTEDGNVDEVGYKLNGELFYVKADAVISTMPLKDLVMCLPDVPEDICQIAKDLPFRDMVTIGMMVKKLKLRNTTSIKTLNNIIPDTWLYIRNPETKLSRVQIYNNWSPYLLRDPKKNVWLGLEYFCQDGDDYWKLNKQQWRNVAVKDLLDSGILANKKDVLTYCVKKISHAIPLYCGSYNQLDKLLEYLDSIGNLYSIGRNGQHRNNTTDHSILTAFAAVKHITGRNDDKKRIRQINNAAYADKK